MNKQQPNETSQDNNLKDVEDDFGKVEDMVDRMVNGSGGRISLLSLNSMILQLRAFSPLFQYVLPKSSGRPSWRLQIISRIFVILFLSRLIDDVS